MGEDVSPHFCMVFTQYTHDLLGVGCLRERCEPSEVDKDHRDFAPVALEGILGVAGHDQVGKVRRKEALEAGEPIELPDLVGHALLQGAVQLGQLPRLRLHGVVELLDPEQGADAGQQLGLVDGFAQEVVGAGLQPLDALLGGIEGRDHDHREDLGVGMGANLLADLVATHPGHDHVEQDEVGRRRSDEAERLGP